MLLIFDMLNRKTYHVEFGLEMFICIWYNWGEENDTLPSPLLDLSWVQKSHTMELFGTWGTLLASSTKRGRRACWSFEIRLRRGTNFT
jgi:hypothetical protein